METRNLPTQGERVETGPTQFGDDWPGVFIRGDNAFAYAQALRSLLDDDGQQIECPWIYRRQVEALLSLLQSCIVRTASSSPDAPGIGRTRATTGSGDA